MKKTTIEAWNEIFNIYEWYKSVEFIGNPNLNSLFKIFILIFLFVLIITLFKKEQKDSNTEIPTSNNVVNLPVSQNINNCISREDLNFQIDKSDKEIIKVVEDNKKLIAETLAKVNQEIDLSWMESCERILKISNNLQKNLNYYAQRNCEISKFQYYTHLHFRSMIAADIVYNEYKKIKQSCFDINKILYGNNLKLNNYRKQIKKQKYELEKIKEFYYKRVTDLNDKTATLRDKIGKECGKKGYKWWLERTRHKRENSSKNIRK